MSAKDSDSRIVPPLQAWQRWLYAGALSIGGLAMVVAGVAQLAALARALRMLPPAIELMTATPGLLLMGVGITGFGLFALLPPADPVARRTRVQRKPWLDRAQRVVAVALACIVLFPLCSGALAYGTAQYLESNGYHRRAPDPAYRSRFLIMRWAKSPPSGAGQVRPS